MLKIFLTILLFTTSVFAEPSVFDMFNEALEKQNTKNITNNTDISQNTDKKNNQISIEEMQNIAPTDEINLNLKDDQIYEKIEPNQITFDVLNMPQSVLQNEIFKFDIIAYIKDSIDISMHTDINTSSNLQILNNNFEWVDIGNSKYKATIWAVIKNSSDSNISLKLTLDKNGEFYQSAFISPQLPKINLLNPNSNFSQIVADDLRILKYKTSHFDDKNYIMVVELMLKNGDLSLFRLNNKNIIKQGVDSIKGTYVSQSAFYFVTFDPTLKNLDFNYYNKLSKKFESFSLKVEVEGDELSTQIGLNPQESDFEFYKDLSIYALILFFAAMFVWKKKYYFLVLSVLFLACAVYDYNPFGVATLKANSNIRIIPTEKSTIFYITNQNENVKILATKDEYKKIITKDGLIGWVKGENLFKD